MGDRAGDWSIVAREPETGNLAIAAATRFFAVGSIVPHIRGGIGAVATQAFASPLYGIDGLAMLASGHAPHEILETLSARDEGREQRQFHLIDNKGNNAAFTGAGVSIGRGIWSTTMYRWPATCWLDRR